MDLSKPPQAPHQAPGISVVIPVLNEALGIEAALESVRRAVPGGEILVVDGGSGDGTQAALQAWSARDGGRTQLLHSVPGRAAQMNRGAEQAAGDILLFVHADTVLPGGAEQQVRQALTVPQVVGGAFRHGFLEDSPGLRMISAWSNLRSRCWRNFYGDQALFVRRTAFHALSGFQDLPVFEDLDLSRRMRRAGRTVLLASAVRTSGRRFLQDGLGRTLWRILRLKLRYVLGGDLQQPARDHWKEVRRP